MSVTKKQRAFIDHYLKCWNATEAAKQAGYSEKTAYSIGWENLRKPEIAEAISKRLSAMAMTADEALSRLAIMARDGKTENTRLRALEIIGKHHGLFADRVEHSGGQELVFRVVYGDDRESSAPAQSASEAGRDQRE